MNSRGRGGFVSAEVDQGLNSATSAGINGFSRVAAHS